LVVRSGHEQFIVFRITSASSSFIKQPFQQLRCNYVFLRFLIFVLELRENSLISELNGIQVALYPFLFHLIGGVS
jgi:hypothetical protein